MSLIQRFYDPQEGNVYIGEAEERLSDCTVFNLIMNSSECGCCASKTHRMS